MKKTRILLVGVAALASTGIIAGCAGGGDNSSHEMDAKALYKLALENTSKQTGYSGEGAMAMEMTVAALGFEKTMSQTAKMTTELDNKNKIIHSVVETTEKSATDEEATPKKAEIWMVTNSDDSLTTYTSTNGGKFVKGSLTANAASNQKWSQVTAVNELVLKQIDTDNISIAYANSEKVGDIDCDVLNVTMKGNVVTDMAESMGTDVAGADMFKELDLNDITFTSTLYVAKDTKLPVKSTIDMKDGMQAIMTQAFTKAMEQQAAGTGIDTSSIKMDVNKFDMTMTYSDYGKVSLKLPADVK